MTLIRNFRPTVICTLTFLLATASAQAQNELKCRGAKGGFVFDHPNKNTLSLSFVASSGPAGAAGQNLEPGMCGWTDRAFKDSDARQIQFAVGASDAISIPNYLDDPSHYWTFVVTGTNKDHFESKSHSGVTNAEAVASPDTTKKNNSPGQSPNASSGGIPNPLGGIPNPLGGVPNPLGGVPSVPAGGIPTPVGGLPSVPAGIPTPSVGGVVNVSLGGIPGAPPGGIRIGGGLAAKLKGKLRRLALDTARVSQLNKLIRGAAKPAGQAPDTADLPVITDVAAALADQSVIFSFSTKPGSLPLVELATTLPVFGPDRRLSFQVGPGLVAHPADGDTATGQYWVDMSQKLDPGKTYYYIISVWKNNNPSAPRGQFIGSFEMPAVQEEQPSDIPPN
jgi:hypothetical protein